MSFSIFTYAIFTGLCGFATEAWHIAILRFIASLGMGGEWALGVALVNELWTKGNRIWVAGAIGAAANIGYLLVAFLSLGLNSYVESWHGMGLAIGTIAGVGGQAVPQQRLAFSHDQRRLPSDPDLFHPLVRAGVGEVARRERGGQHLPLEQHRSLRRADRRRGRHGHHLGLVAHGAGLRSAWRA
jgi:MFS family permease